MNPPVNGAARRARREDVKQISVRIRSGRVNDLKIIRTVPVAINEDIDRDIARCGPLTVRRDGEEDLRSIAMTEFVALKSLVTPTDFKSALLATLVAGIVAGLVPCNSNALTSEITSVGKLRQC